MTIREALDTLVGGGTLSADGAERVFEELLAGALDAAQVAALLAMIQARGPTVDEVVGGARAMRRHVTPVPIDRSAPGELIDTCGTGGAPKTFNVSTLAAIAAAAAAPGRVRVAKHGNRSRTGRGSAELLGALGVNVDAASEVQALCLRETGVCFCFAIHHHPAMKHAAPVRRSLGFPTIFNLLGPLTNPAGARRQLIGVSSAGSLDTVAGALRALGADRALVAHGADGLDELTITAPTHLALVEHATVTARSFDAADAGLARARFEDLCAADLDHAVGIARRVLAGERGPIGDMVALNAGAALFVAGASDSIEAGVALARAALDRGQAGETLRALAYASHARP